MLHLLHKPSLQHFCIPLEASWPNTAVSSQPAQSSRKITSDSFQPPLSNLFPDNHISRQSIFEALQPWMSNYLHLLSPALPLLSSTSRLSAYWTSPHGFHKNFKFNVLYIKSVTPILFISNNGQLLIYCLLAPNSPLLTALWKYIWALYIFSSTSWHWGFQQWVLESSYRRKVCFLVQYAHLVGCGSVM